jgi:hypothetical protein
MVSVIENTKGAEKMKFETKLQKALEHKSDTTKKLALYNLGFKCIPGSNEQKKVFKELDKLADVKLAWWDTAH